VNKESIYTAVLEVKGKSCVAFCKSGSIQRIAEGNLARRIEVGEDINGSPLGLTNNYEIIIWGTKEGEIHSQALS